MSKITKGDVSDDDVIKSQENGAKSNSTQESADSPPAEGGEGSSSGISSEDEEVGEDSEGESDDEEEGLVDLEDLGMILKIFNFSKGDFVHKKYIKKRLHRLLLKRFIFLYLAPVDQIPKQLTIDK